MLQRGTVMTYQFSFFTCILLSASLLLSGCSPRVTPSVPPYAAEDESANGETAAEEIPVSSESAAPGKTPDPEKTPDLEGLTLSILGDSISTFEGYIPSDYSAYYPLSGKITQVEDTWWHQVLTRTGMVLGGNASYSNSTVTGDSSSTTDGLAACSFRRISDLQAPDGTSPDLILIYTGINDFLHCAPLGTFSGVPSAQPEGRISVFADAYELMLQKTLAAYPDARIYVCTLTETDAGDVKEPRSYPSTNENGNVIADFNQIITDLAAAYGLPLIDLYHCGITYDNLYELTGDGLHPRPSGAKLIADKVLEALETPPGAPQAQGEPGV